MSVRETKVKLYILMFILYNYDICANNMPGYLIIKYLHYLVDILTCSKWKKKDLTIFILVSILKIRFWKEVFRFSVFGGG